MSIKKQFGSASIRKPGSYSRSSTDPSAGGNSATTGVMLVIGEADAGPGGSAEGIKSYSSQAYSRLKAKYRGGPLVDTAKAAIAPSRTPGIGGYDTVLVYQTNTPTKAELELANSYGTVKDREGGIGGNRVTFKNTLTSESAISATGSAAVTDFAGLDGETLEVARNGGDKETVTFSTPADADAVVTQINSVLTGVTASHTDDVLTLTLDAGSDTHRNGWGRTLEVVGGTALAKLFMSAALSTPADEVQASLELLQPRDNVEESEVLGGDIAFRIGRDSSDSCTAATVAVSSTAMTLTQTGASPASYSLSLEDHPRIGNLVDAIEQLSGWSVSIPAALRTQYSSTLDQISATGCFSENGEMPGRIKRDAYTTSVYFENSNLVTIEDQASKGLPDTIGRTNLTGGARGASASSNFDAGLTAALGQDLNGIVIAASQDADEDITAGITDAASTYDIETLHAALSTHLNQRGNIKNRKEAQGAVGYRVATKAAAFEQAALIGDSNIQMCMEDVNVVDSSGELKWKQPHIFAAMLMGMRLGSSIGEPLTHKTLAVQGVGHYVNTATGVKGGDFDPLIDYDAAIDAGVTCSEPASGGHRVMVDNTTYGADENFVWNRGSVVEASQYAAKTVRLDAEAAFVGRKNSVITAGSIKNRIRSKLVELFRGQVLAPSDDAPQGFLEDTFIVNVTGNTAEVSVEIKPVQSIDFVLIEFSLGETTQAA